MILESYQLEKYKAMISELLIEASKIAKRNCPWYRYPSIGYWYGNITSKPNIPEKVFGYKVKTVTANGGWTAMDYIVTLEKEVE